MKKNIKHLYTVCLKVSTSNVALESNFYSDYKLSKDELISLSKFLSGISDFERGSILYQGALILAEDMPYDF